MHVSMPPETPPPDDARRGPSSSEGGNVVDPAVLAERRAQRAEQAEQSAARRAADAQVLAAQLARERARLAAERDAARAEAAAAREGADAAIAEARHLQAERDTLREALIEARRERDQLVASASAPAPVEPAAAAGPASAPDVPPAAPASEPGPTAPPLGGPPAATNGVARNGHAAAPAAWTAALRRELVVARSAAAIAAPATTERRPSTPVPGLARERRLLDQRVAGGPVPAARPASAGAGQRRGDRAAPITALALERERSSRLQAQLDSSLAVQRELRTHVAALQRAIHQRVEAERRIEAALRRVREELTAANALAAGGVVAPATPPVAERPSPSAPPVAPAAPADAPAAVVPALPAGPPRAAAGSAAPSAIPMPPAPASEPPASAASAAPPAAPTPEATAPAQPSGEPLAAPQPPAPSAGPTSPAAVSPSDQPPAPAPAALDPLRLSAARERLRASVPPAEEAAEPAGPLPAGPPVPWLTEALQRLLASEPETAGRIAVGLLPAHGLAAEKPLRYDLLLSGRGCLAVDVMPGARATVTQQPAPRPRSERDLSVAGDAVGVARLLYGRRTLLRRPARVRGGRKALRELRRLARAPLGVRELGEAGVALEPALALRLVALVIDAEATRGERFAVAHVPLAGGPIDAWLRIADGAEPAVVTSAPSEPTRLTLRCTRGALLALIAGVDPPPGEAGTLDGDDRAVSLLRSWIARTEHPAA
jgi:hypothetical protein